MAIHIIFFITMYTIDTNIDKNRRDMELGTVVDDTSEEFIA